MLMIQVLSTLGLLVQVCTDQNVDSFKTDPKT